MKAVFVFGVLALLAVAINGAEPRKDENLDSKTLEVIGKLRRAQVALDHMEKKLVEEQQQGLSNDQQELLAPQEPLKSNPLVTSKLKLVFWNRWESCLIT